MEESYQLSCGSSILLTGNWCSSLGEWCFLVFLLSCLINLTVLSPTIVWTMRNPGVMLTAVGDMKSIPL